MSEAVGVAPAGWRLAFAKRAAEVGFLAVLPLAVVASAVALAVDSGEYAADFRGALYPEAQLVLEGRNPFPDSRAPRVYPEPIHPIPAALAVAPLTVLPREAAGAAFSIVLAAALAATLLLLGVRDWRVFGLVALWPAAIAGVQAGNLSALLVLLVAAAWATCGRRLAPGVYVGLAIALKLFLWPLVLWLAVTRRWAAAAVAAAAAPLTTLSLLPFTSPGEYGRLMDTVAAKWGPQGMGPAALVSQLGVSWPVAQIAGYALAGALLLVALWYRSFALTVVAALLLSPVVWLHSYVLLLVPLALASPSLSALWALPLALWVCDEATSGGEAWQTALAVGVAVAIGAVAARRERARPVLYGPVRRKTETSPAT